MAVVPAPSRYLRVPLPAKVVTVPSATLRLRWLLPSKVRWTIQKAFFTASGKCVHLPTDGVDSADHVIFTICDEYVSRSGDQEPLGTSEQRLHIWPVSSSFSAASRMPLEEIGITPIQLYDPVVQAV